MDEAKIMEARCPECGSPDVDLSYSLRPIEDGCKCFDCGHIYMLGEDTEVEITIEPTLFDKLRDMSRRNLARLTRRNGTPEKHKRGIR